MISKKRFAILLGTATLCAVGYPPSTATAQPVAIAQTASQRLAALFAASNEGDLERNPIGALFRGDMRFAGRLGDNISDAYFAAERDSAATELATLKSIDRSKLTASERISYDVFKWQRTSDLRGLQPDL